MRITRFGHSCVRLRRRGRPRHRPRCPDRARRGRRRGRRPGDHEHPDHWTIDHLRAAEAPVWTIAAVAQQIREAGPEVGGRVHVVEPGQELDVAGYVVRVVGRKHAVIHPELTHVDNSGFVVTSGGTSLFHPGDSFELPARPSACKSGLRSLHIACAAAEAATTLAQYDRTASVTRTTPDRSAAPYMGGGVVA